MVANAEEMVDMDQDIFLHFQEQKNVFIICNLFLATILTAWQP
jgi:hypothetical protein